MLDIRLIREKPDVVRERLRSAGRQSKRKSSLEAIADLIGSVNDLPSDLSSHKKHYLRSTGYGKRRSR